MNTSLKKRNYYIVLEVPLPSLFLKYFLKEKNMQHLLCVVLCMREQLSMKER